MAPLLLTAVLLQPAPHLDATGDPLPSGALCRIGTTRLRPGGLVTALAFSADGKRLVTANDITGVHVWETATGKELRAWRPPESVAALSTDGTLAATAGATGRVYTVADGAVVCTFDGKGAGYTRMVFSADARLLAAVADPGKVEIRAVATGKLLHTLPCSGGQVAFAPDGRSVAVAHQSGTIDVFELATGKKRTRFGAGKGESHYNGLAFAPDGKTLAAVLLGPQCVECWDVAEGRCQFSTQVNFVTTDRLVFTPDGRHVIANDGEGRVCLWDAATGKVSQELPDLAGNLPAIAVSPDGTLLATAGTVVRLWRLPGGKQSPDFGSPTGNALLLTGIRFAADGKTVVTSHWLLRPRGVTCAACSRDAATGKLARNVEFPFPQDKLVEIAPDGSALAVADGGVVEVTDPVTKQVLLRREQAGRVLALQFRRDGKYLVVQRHLAGKQQPDVLQLWDVAAGKVRLELTGDGGFGRVQFSPDGRFVMLRLPADGGGQNLRGFEVATGHAVPRLSLVTSVQLAVPSPDGRLLALAYDDRGALVLREIATGKLVTLLATNSQEWVSVAFSPDSRLLAAGTVTGEVLLFDVVTGKLLTTWRGHRHRADVLAWSPDGTRLASGGAEGSIVVWDARPWHQQARAVDGTLTTATAQALWVELGAEAEGRGWPAVVRLAQAPAEAVALLKRWLRPATASDVTPLKQALADLASAQPAVRDQAAADLAKAAELALPLVDQALANRPPPEVRKRLEDLRRKVEEPSAAAEVVRLSRALRVLEWIGNEDARSVLQSLAEGEPDAWLTVEARAALQRLARNHQ
jgi:WD40 repeat protein